MPDERTTLPVVPVPGLRLDSLGNYLASLGLLRALARSRWPGVRAAWNSDVLHIVGGPTSMDDMLEALWEVAAKLAWTPYERGWVDAQKISTKRKSGRPLALWQASAAEQDLELFSAHLVPAARVSFNPLLGSGGNAGKRDFSDGWRRAIQAIGRGPDTVQERSDLKCVLLGEPVGSMMGKLNAASWFSDANKLYNSGQHAYRDGAISPWAMALACEGLIFFSGSPSRRLGSRARAAGAFPFVTQAAGPRTTGESGRDLAEVWAPVWRRPMTLPEVVALFSRGRAEAGGRGVLTPCAFATAVMRRGVDAGIAEFRRFVLGRTTSANTFEPRFEGVFHVHETGPAARSWHVDSIAMECLLAFVSQFVGPLDDSKRYVGLRGGIEAGMLHLAESPSNSDAARDLLDSVVSALDRIDRNKSFREQGVRWQPLPLDWLPTLLGDEGPSTETRLALALVSSFPTDRPFAPYRFGVARRGRQFIHPSQAPRQWVWRSVLPVPQAMSNVLYRRTLDWEASREVTEPVRLGVPVDIADVDRWLSGEVDNDLLARWISRFTLFDWRAIPYSLKSLASRQIEVHAASGALCLFGLLQPLFDLRSVSNLLPRESGARTPAAARRLLGLLRTGDVSAAVRFAAGRYSVAGTPIVRNDVPWSSVDVERLTASFLFSVFDRESLVLATRWLRPLRK